MTLYSQDRWCQQPNSAPVEGGAASRISFLPVFCSISHGVCLANSVMPHFFLFFSKMFDTELCPLPFSLEEMFGFISCRFTGYPSSVQEQALLWLHVSVLAVLVMLKQLIILKKNPLFQSWCTPSALCSNMRVVGRQTLSVANPSWAIT